MDMGWVTNCSHLRHLNGTKRHVAHSDLGIKLSWSYFQHEMTVFCVAQAGERAYIHFKHYTWRMTILPSPCNRIQYPAHSFTVPVHVQCTYGSVCSSAFQLHKKGVASDDLIWLARSFDRFKSKILNNCRDVDANRSENAFLLPVTCHCIEPVAFVDW